MKTDRELLEAAAKAARFNVDFADYRDLGSQVVYRKRDEYLTWWNPLTDDGDALRLAVGLAITIRAGLGWALVEVKWDDYGTYSIEQDHGDDKQAATRRAIVRAAAALAPVVDEHTKGCKQ